MSYRIEFTSEALEILRRLPARESQAIFIGIEGLVDHPNQLYTFHGPTDTRRSGDIEFQRSEDELIIYTIHFELSDLTGEDVEDPYMLVLAFWPSIGTWPWD